ncbi:hypothetical protein QJS10_CPB22g00635 [Acorus calamus]|uniref:Uncharacterized protein n=1 Tax=Acorus calamus TaxID=4465 RepID=A0AAV9BYJ2_ACOCL|nr:hypothetical protein QJS10_CPB22g00635 [Acorus calamus]
MAPDASGATGRIIGAKNVERNLGNGIFLLKVMNSQLRARMARRGIIHGTEGVLRMVPWTPEFGAEPGETYRWNVRLGGLPLHWQHDDSLRTLMNGFGNITKFERKGIGRDGRSTTEFTLVAGVKQKWTETMVVGYGREAFRIRVKARRTQMVSKLSWADLLKETEDTRPRKNPLDHGKANQRRRRRSSHASGLTRYEFRTQQPRSNVVDENRIDRAGASCHVGTWYMQDL